jgi:hypothetical protein
MVLPDWDWVGDCFRKIGTYFCLDKGAEYLTFMIAMHSVQVTALRNFPMLNLIFPVP